MLKVGELQPLALVLLLLTESVHRLRPRRQAKARALRELSTLPLPPVEFKSNLGECLGMQIIYMEVYIEGEFEESKF